ncbi:unnamed protein product [Prorocentrum cordatum]|uniref:Uncharacterized protein n=1 Tax=Prorocentrum cordatum TaxID=2364126 RepID=A0ABN9WM44_9DINO|nr:unnamed protein product [Polarella glacialis]
MNPPPKGKREDGIGTALNHMRPEDLWDFVDPWLPGAAHYIAKLDPTPWEGPGERQAPSTPVPSGSADSVSYKAVQHDSQNKASVHEFVMHDEQEFWVSLTWPSARMVKPCSVRMPAVTLAVSKVSESGVEGEPVMGEDYGWVLETHRAKVSLGSGRYVVLASAHFPYGDFIRQVVLTVYSAAAVDIGDSHMPAPALGLAMFGAGGGSGADCSAIMIHGHGMYVANHENQIGGLPTYWSFDGESFAYFVSGADKWYLIDKSYWQVVQQGEYWSFAQLDRSSLTCGCQDSENGPSGFSGLSCSDVKAPNNRYANVECDSGSRRITHHT